MANEFDGERSRRRYPRVTGPFEGVLDEPVLIYDLNLGGCFINSTKEPVNGSILELKIQLPQEGWITVRGEALYRHQHGFALRFLELDADTAARIVRTVDALKNQWRL